ncbi:MAG: hypothetical protein ACRDNJ_05245 [Solirubrobacteraceae bacterium]
MIPFFLPGTRAGMDPDPAYAELRAQTERRIGRPVQARRIYVVDARRAGVDSETRVGERDPCAGETVRAIFATTAGYTVVWEGGHVDLTKRQIYEAIPFD